MFFPKLLFLAVLAFASTVFAGRVAFSTRYVGGVNGVAKNNRYEQYDDHKAEEIFNNMNTWSDGKYKTSKHAATGIITVSSDTVYANKNDAIAAVTDMISTVTAHYQGPTNEKVRARVPVATPVPFHA